MYYPQALVFGTDASRRGAVVSTLRGYQDALAAARLAFAGAAFPTMLHYPQSGGIRGFSVKFEIESILLSLNMFLRLQILILYCLQNKCGLVDF